MQRVTLALTDEAAERFERFIRERGYTNRSEAFRDLLRQADAAERLKDEETPCAAVVSYVYNHHERQLAARMTEHQHEHGDVVHSVMHVHLNHEDCLEAIISSSGPRRPWATSRTGSLRKPGCATGASTPFRWKAQPGTRSPRSRPPRRFFMRRRMRTGMRTTMTMRIPTSTDTIISTDRR